MKKSRIHPRVRPAAVVGLVLGLVGSALWGAAPAGADTGAPPTSPCAAYAVPAPGYLGSALITMNDAGLYVGSVTSADGELHAAYWRHTPGASPATGWSLTVPQMPATGAVFLDVNASGVMTGFSDDLNQGFVYDSTTGWFHWLPDFQGGSNLYPRRINDSGVIAGEAMGPAPDFTSYAATWTPPYTVANRVGVPGETQNVTYTDDSGTHHVQLGSFTYGINDHGTLAGTTGLGGPTPDVSVAARGHFWRNYLAPLAASFTTDMAGHFNRLPALGGQSWAYSINDSGVVVGSSLRDGFTTPAVPVAWINGRVVDLGAPSDVQNGIAYDVSQAGWVTGGVLLADGTHRSFVWTGSGTMQANAPLPGDTDTWSHGVSDLLHQVAGNSTDSTGNDHATVWQCPTGFTTG